MDLWKWLAIHFPGENHLVCLYLGPRNADEVVHGLVRLEVSLGSIQLEMLRSILETTTVLDYLLQADADIFGGTDGPFCPWRLRDFVTLAGVKTDLLDTACALMTRLIESEQLFLRNLRSTESSQASPCAGIWTRPSNQPECTTWDC